MTPEDFIHHALVLVSADSRPIDINLRRAVSACYYALFHRINADATQLIAPNVRTETNHRIQRWFEHAEMKKVCGRFLSDHLDQPLRDLIGDSASEDLRTVCRTFRHLQEARHSADYDPGYALTWESAVIKVQSVIEAVIAWNRIKDTAEANVFILSLLLWKNWEKDR